MIQSGQNYIVNSITEYKLDNNYLQNMFYCVFFQPSTGKFLFEDRYYHWEIIFPMIEKDILKFTGIKKHQGELMPSYSI